MNANVFSVKIVDSRINEDYRFQKGIFIDLAGLAEIKEDFFDMINCVRNFINTIIRK